ncbi:hypothetical protein SAMN05443580_105316 [Variovorax sp. OV084]|nr:hypothetical protein SAMN05443580_105316 [Variovorax sp. OV084]
MASSHRNHQDSWQRQLQTVGSSCRNSGCRPADDGIGCQRIHLRTGQLQLHNHGDHRASGCYRNKRSTGRWNRAMVQHPWLQYEWQRSGCRIGVRNLLPRGWKWSGRFRVLQHSRPVGQRAWPLGKCFRHRKHRAWLWRTSSKPELGRNRRSRWRRKHGSIGRQFNDRFRRRGHCHRQQLDQRGSSDRLGQHRDWRGRYRCRPRQHGSWQWG